MSNPWWSKQPQADPNAPPGENSGPAHGAGAHHPMQPQQSPSSRSAPAPSGNTVSGDSLGEQIDDAIGDFERRLSQLRDDLENHKTQIIDIEAEIENTEKDQAKAFKSLLSDNPAIKKMLETGGSRRKTNRRKTSRRKGDDKADGH